MSWVDNHGIALLGEHRVARASRELDDGSLGVVIIVVDVSRTRAGHAHTLIYIYTVSLRSLP